MQYGATTLAKYSSAKAPAAMLNAGMHWVRVQVNNRSVETSPGVYDWTATDAALQPFFLAGMQVILPLQDFATWWLNGNDLPTAAGMISWGTALIMHYGALLAGIELGNEEYAFATGAARDPSVYYAVISQAYPALHRVAFDLLHLPSQFTIGCFGYTNYSGTSDGSGGNGDPLTYFLALFQLGALLFMDYVNFHRYSNIFSAAQQNPGGAPPILAIVGAINAAQNAVNYAPYKPIRVTEFGWQGFNWGGSCPNVIGPLLQAQYTAQLYDLLITAPSVTHAFLYTVDATDAGWQDCHDIYTLASYPLIAAAVAQRQPGGATQ